VRDSVANSMSVILGENVVRGRLMFLVKGGILRVAAGFLYTSRSQKD